MSLERLKLNQKSYYILSISAFWGWPVESQPSNLDFRNNPENFHPCVLVLYKGIPVLNQYQADDKVTQYSI